jgi:hypothetical protein
MFKIKQNFKTIQKKFLKHTLIPNDFNTKQTLAKWVRWISGTLFNNNSSL